MYVDPRFGLDSHGPVESVQVAPIVLVRRSISYAAASSDGLGLPVRNVHTRGFGLGRIGVGSGRIAHVSGTSQCLQGLECSSSPTSGTVFSQVRSFLLV